MSFPRLTFFPPPLFSDANITAAFLMQRKYEPRGPLVRIGHEVWKGCLY